MNSRNAGGNCNSSRNTHSQKLGRHFCYLETNYEGKTGGYVLTGVYSCSQGWPESSKLGKCGRSIICEGRWSVETLINSLIYWYKPLLRSHYLQPLDTWSLAFFCEILVEYPGMSLLFSVCGIRNWEDTSVPWLPRYTSAIDLEDRAPPPTMSLEFRQLCNKVVFINLIVNHCIPIPLWGGTVFLPY